MSSSIKAGAVGFFIGMIVTLAAVYFYSSIKQSTVTTTDEGTSESSSPVSIVTSGAATSNTPIGNTPSAAEDKPPAPPLQPVKRKPVPKEAVERIVPRLFKAEFALTGKGYDANWGMGKSANFQYTVCVEAKSEILSKETLPTGKIEVREKRTFIRVYDSIVASEVDFHLALDTLPTVEFSKMIDGTGVLVSSWTGQPEAGASILTANKSLNYQLQKVNDKGLRALLGWTGVQPEVVIEAKLNELAGNQLTKAVGVMRPISGKCYLISYLQEESGQPMMVDFKNEDGGEITDEEEQKMLKRINLFIDYHLVPNTQRSLGENWGVYADDMQGLFDPFVDGKYTGEIRFTRKSNAKNGDWVIDMKPGTVNISAEGGKTGSIMIKKGWVQMDPKNVCLNDFFVDGTVKMQKLTQHHLLFKAKLDGKCKFQGRAVTVPL